MHSNGNNGQAQAELRDALIILNPRAGRAKNAQPQLDRARRILSDHGIASELTPTDGPGAATEIARRAAAAGKHLVMVCGGDGTLNEVVNGLAGTATP